MSKTAEDKAIRELIDNVAPNWKGDDCVPRDMAVKAAELYAQQRVSELEQSNKELVEENNGLMASIKGVLPKLKRLKELGQSNKELVEASDRMGEAMDKLLKGLATDGIAIEGFTDAWTARHRYVELKLKIELSRTKEVVPDNTSAI